jgi:hypothetical protein
MATMGQGRRNLLQIVLSVVGRWAKDQPRRRRQRPPAAGVREPRRPKPTLPTAAIALDEPRTDVRRKIRLTNLRDTQR